MPIGRLVQRFRRRRIVDKTVRYGWFPGHCKPSSRSLFVCKSPGNFLVIRVFVYVVHPAFLWVILGLACRGVCVGCAQHRFSRRPLLRPSLVFRSHASHPSPSCTASVLRSCCSHPLSYGGVGFPSHASHPSPSCTASVLRPRRSLSCSYGSVLCSRFLFVVLFPCSPFIFRFFRPAASLMLLLSIWFLGR